jgi:hypothetical protein
MPDKISFAEARFILVLQTLGQSPKPVRAAPPVTRQSRTLVSKSSTCQ